VSLRYSNIPDRKWKGIPLGEHDKDTMEKVRHSHRVVVESNVVVIKVQN
jgi:hypothetical protein